MDDVNAVLTFHSPHGKKPSCTFRTAILEGRGRSSQWIYITRDLRGGMEGRKRVISYYLPWEFQSHGSHLISKHNTEVWCCSVVKTGSGVKQKHEQYEGKKLQQFGATFTLLFTTPITEDSLSSHERLVGYICIQRVLAKWEAAWEWLLSDFH